MSILGEKSDNRGSATQWLTDSKTLEKAHVRQNRGNRYKGASQESDAAGVVF
jgi:hypothetical protein